MADTFFERFKRDDGSYVFRGEICKSDLDNMRVPARVMTDLAVCFRQGASSSAQIRGLSILFNYLGPRKIGG